MVRPRKEGIEEVGEGDEDDGQDRGVEGVGELIGDQRDPSHVGRVKSVGLRRFEDQRADADRRCRCRAVGLCRWRLGRRAGS